MKLKNLLLHAASLLLALAAHADTSVPYFTPADGSLSVREWSYTWQSATEDAATNLRTDTYSVDVDDGTGNISTFSLTVQGRIGYPSLATVSGTDPAYNAIDGYLSSWANPPGTITISTYNDRAPTPFNHDFSAGPVGNSVYMGDTEMFQTEDTTTYTVDLSATPPVLRDTFIRCYNTDAYGYGWGVTVHKEEMNPYARVSGAITGYYWQGAYYIDGSTPASEPSTGLASLIFFGSTYDFVDGGESTTYSWNGTQVVGVQSSVTDSYQGEDGSASISYSSSTASRTINAWHAHGGGMSGAVSSTGSITWNLRSAPLLASAQLALVPSAGAQPVLLNWSSASSTVDHSTGEVTDVYSAASGEIATLTGVPKTYWDGTSFVSVTLSGGGLGAPVAGDLWALSGFDVGAGRVLEDATPVPGASPAFAASSLWLNRIGFDFDQAYTGPGGLRKDIYRSAVGGSISILGIPGDEIPEAVWVSTGAITGAFGYDDGAGNMIWDFNVSGCTITTEAPPDPAAAYWVDGVLYTRGGTSLVYAPLSDNDRELRITPVGSEDFKLTLWDQQAGSALAEAIWYRQNGLFFLTTPSSTLVPVYAADTDGTPHLPEQDTQLNLPPFLQSVSGIESSTNGLLVFIGTNTDVAGSGADMAYYAAAGCSSLVQIALQSSGHRQVIVLNCADGGRKAGIYHVGYRLFQATAPTAQTGSLPMPLYAVHDSDNNHVLWNLPRPGDSSDDRPDSFIVRGEVWRFSHFDDDDAIYLGYLEGQTLKVGLLSDDGRNQREVTLTQPDGSSSRGLLDIRGSARLRNGLVVFSGDYDGLRVTPTGVETDNLHTIAADLDLTGNVISFGSLLDDVGIAGAAFQFVDTPVPGTASSIATLHTSLSRHYAEWIWWKSGATAADAPQPVMQLDTANRLNLYPPGSTNQSAPGITLDPTAGGTSTIRGVLRVRPGGDIDMGAYKQSPVGMTAP